MGHIIRFKRRQPKRSASRPRQSRARQPRHTLWLPWLVLAVLAAVAYIISSPPLAETNDGNTVNANDGNTLTGVASVIDGDTIEIHGTRIRLHGIDAPESGQLCKRAENGGGNTAQGEYRCGQKAAFALSDKLGRKTVRCDPRGHDRYKRTLAVCYLGTLDLNGWMVTEGWALAYRKYTLDYVEEENEARAARRGLWAGAFTPPWAWRQAHPRR